MAAHTRQRRHGRSPHGERGLKFKTLLDENKARGSLSSWRAWIEINDAIMESSRIMSLSSWRAWIEIGVCIVPATAWMLLSLFRSSVPCTCGIPHVRDC